MVTSEISGSIIGDIWLTHQSGSEPVNDSARPYNRITSIGITNTNLKPLLMNRRSILTKLRSYSWSFLMSS